MARLNRPLIPAGGEVFKSIGQDWTLYKITDERFKLCANKPIEGHANFSLTIKGGRIQSTGDKSKLRNANPFLYEDVERAMGAPEALSGPDKFGDIATADKRPLTAEQQWQRRLLYIREKMLTQENIDIRLAIHALYIPIFLKQISEEDAMAAVEYLNKGDAPNPESLQNVLRAYYAGEYRPRPMETLELNLDILQGIF